MYELIQISEHCYYIQSPAKIGFVRTSEDEVCLIDSGNDRDAGKKVRKILDAKGWRLRAIYNTHSHADHIGGNQYLQSQTGCRVFAPGIERDFTAHPVLEPSFLYGANPPGDLRHKFLMAQESDAEALTGDDLPDGWEMIPLPGHSFDMTGFRTQDDIVYLADCLSSRATLEKYQVGFLVNPGKYIETLERVRTMKAKLFVPAHADAAEDVGDLAQLNIDKVREIADGIVGICAGPRSFEQILRKVFEIYRLTMSFEQHALVGCTLRSYLSWLMAEGRLQAGFHDNTLVWRAK